MVALVGITNLPLLAFVSSLKLQSVIEQILAGRQTQLCNFSVWSGEGRH